MTLLAITSFSGEAPRYAKDKLPNSAAQVALNCEFSSGDLQSVPGLGDLSKRAGGLTNPTGAFFTDDANFFCWTGDYTACKGAVIDDFFQRVYYTDGSAYLRVIWQYRVVQGVAGWSSATTYGSGQEVTVQTGSYAAYSALTTYKKGDVVEYTGGSKVLYRCLKTPVLAITPGTDLTAWELWGEGIRYRSLQAGNLNNPPATSPTWWIQNGLSLVGLTTRAGVPVPEDWTAKLYGAGTYQVNALTADATGELSVYNVPTAVADARAAVDGSLTGVANTNALIAVARNRLHANLNVRAKETSANNTATAYYDSATVKLDEAIISVYPITPGRLYAFDAPEKDPYWGTYVVTQLWIDSGGDEDIQTVDLENQGA